MPRVIKAGIEQIIGLEDPKGVLVKIEHCGRTAYKTWDKESEGSAERFVAMIVRLGHESVLEHASVTVVVNCDRATAQQLTRHRLASFTMESQRYCNYGGDRFGGEITFVDPEPQTKTAQDWDNFYKFWHEFLGRVEADYMRLVSSGVPAEDARCILPNCTACSVAVTANLREWRHILKIRTESHAQHNIRALMGQILQRFREAIPCVVADIA